MATDQLRESGTLNLSSILIQPESGAEEAMVMERRVNAIGYCQRWVRDQVGSVVHVVLLKCSQDGHQSFSIVE